MFVLAAGMLGCASGKNGTSNPDAPVVGTDTDGDGVPDSTDKCPNTPPGEPVNSKGCSDSQTKPMVEHFPPSFPVTWTPTGDLGRAGGLTWAYTGIDRKDLFHIWWVLCDDPVDSCGLSLDGPINSPTMAWIASLPDSDLGNGKLVLKDTTRIALADGSKQALPGRLTVTIVDANSAPIAWANVSDLGLTARAGGFGFVVEGTSYTLTALAEVQDPNSLTWTPYLDYFDAAPTVDMGTGTAVSFGGSFYDK